MAVLWIVYLLFYLCKLQNYACASEVRYPDAFKAHPLVSTAVEGIVADSGTHPTQTLIPYHKVIIQKFFNFPGIQFFSRHSLTIDVENGERQLAFQFSMTEARYEVRTEEDDNLAELPEQTFKCENCDELKHEDVIDMKLYCHLNNDQVLGLSSFSQAELSSANLISCRKGPFNLEGDDIFLDVDNFGDIACLIQDYPYFSLNYNSTQHKQNSAYRLTDCLVKLYPSEEAKDLNLLKEKIASVVLPAKPPTPSNKQTLSILQLVISLAFSSSPFFIWLETPCSFPSGDHQETIEGETKCFKAHCQNYFNELFSYNNLDSFQRFKKGRLHAYHEVCMYPYLQQKDGQADGNYVRHYQFFYESKRFLDLSANS